MTKNTAETRVFVGFHVRATALFVDLVLMACLFIVIDIALQTVQTRPSVLGRLLGWTLPGLYFACMPLTGFQGTLGKRLLSIKLCDLNGDPLTWRRSLWRSAATLIWLVGIPYLNWHTYGCCNFGGAVVQHVSIVPWLMVIAYCSAGVLPRRQSLFDLLAGTMVVNKSATRERIASLAPGGAVSVWKLILTALLSLAFLVIAESMMFNYRVHNIIRARVSSAIFQTQDVRQKIEKFHGREHRAPTPLELGVPEWTPYPGGGGFSVRPDGSIEIQFAVVPELKGHRIILRPREVRGGTWTEWKCEPDAEIPSAYLTADCRSEANMLMR